MALIFHANGGNDTTGTGAIGTPYATPDKALSVAASNDIVISRGGTYTHTTTATYTAANLTWRAYPGETPVITGNNSNYLRFSGAGRHAIIGITLNNSGTGTAATQTALYATSSSGTINLQYCKFNNNLDRGIVTSAAGGSLGFLIEDCEFNYTGSGRGCTVNPSGLGSVSQFSFNRNKVKNYTSISNYRSSVVSIDSNIFENCAAFGTIGTEILYANFSYNNFISCDYLFTLGSATSYNINALNMKNNVFDLIKILNATSSGTITAVTSIVNNNAINSTTDISGITDTNTVSFSALSDLKFVNYSTSDYRLNLDSPLILGDLFRETIGAIGLESPDTFYDNIPMSNVKSGEGPYKVAERTATHYGSYSAGGSGPVTLHQKLFFRDIASPIDKKMRMGVDYDTKTMALSVGNTVETYSYKLAGITVATLTITYTDNTRVVETSAVWT